MLGSHLGDGAVAVFVLMLAAIIASNDAVGEERESPTVYWGSETLEAQQLEQQYAAKRGTMGRAPRAMVAACHNRSVDIGLAVLKRGGNAVDAFVAATFADYVQSPGASSMGGPLGVLVYSAQDGKVESLLAPLKTVRSETGQWRSGETALGKQVLVPGAVAGLESLHKKYGKLPWNSLVMPAAELADQGFEVDLLYAAIVNNYADTIKHSAYGRETFFHNDGTPLAPGETIKLPAMAETLRAIATEGAAYMLRGASARGAVETVAAAGGEMKPEDLADYEPEWSKALRVSYRGYEVFGIGGHNSGGARLLTALKVLNHADVRSLGHYSESLDTLETMIRICRAVNAESPLATQEFYEKDGLQEYVGGPRADALWAEVVGKTDGPQQEPNGSHSYCVVVIDSEGNAVAGTHTIESMPFGSGLFVGGVPLNNTGVLHPYDRNLAYSTPPGHFIIEPLSATLAFKGHQLVLASSTFSVSLWPADFQLVSSALDFDWNPERIALTPRFGNYALDLSTLKIDATMMQLDKRYGQRVVEGLKSRGVSVSQAGYIDTGMLVLVRRDPKTGELTGFTPEQLKDGKASGY